LPSTFPIPPTPTFSCQLSKFRLFVSPYEVEYDINPFIHAPHLLPGTPPSEPIAIAEPSYEPEVIPDHTSLVHTSSTIVEEQATGPLPSQGSEDPPGFQPEIDPTDHSLVSSPATLLSEANTDIAPFRRRSIDSGDTPTAGVWTPASNEGTVDTEPNELVLPTLHARSSVQQVNISNALGFVTPSVEGNHFRNGPNQCGYCDCIFNRACDLK
jgi:hypothetical protein